MVMARSAHRALCVISCRGAAGRRWPGGGRCRVWAAGPAVRSAHRARARCV